MLYGPFGSIVNGSRLAPASSSSGAMTLWRATSVVQIADPNVTETDLVGAQGGGVTIPGNALGLGGRISAKLFIILTVNATRAGSVTLRVRLGAETIGTEILDATALAIATYRGQLDVDFSTFLATDVQVGHLKGQLQTPEGFQLAAGDWGFRSLVGTRDTTADQALRVTAQFSADIDAVLNRNFGYVELVPA